MDSMEIGQRLAVALGIGLLVGLERERRKGDGPGRGAAGVRTFALVALLGGLVAATDRDVIIAAGAARKDDLSDSGMIRLLTDSGATPDAASALTALYRGDWLATVSLGIWSPGDEGDNYSPLDLLQGRSGWWILLPSGGAGRVNVQPASLGDVQTIIDQAVNTATTAAS